VKIRVYYEDTDVGGIVYHSNYLNYCERARSELFFAQDLLPISKNCSFVVTKVEASFVGSAKLGDLLNITTTILQSKKLSIILLQEIFSSDNKKIFSATIKLAYLNDGKPIQIPSMQLDIIRKGLSLDAKSI